MFKKLILSTLVFASLLTVSAKAPDDSKKHKNLDPKSVNCPDEMEKNYDDLVSIWMEENQDVIDCEYNTDAVIFFDDSTYMDKLYALPTMMELAYNPIVKRFIEMYAGRRRNQVSYMLGKGSYYFPLFEEILDREGLPMELKYLPVIESALNPVARSRVGAAGLWQFMPRTGKLYKLEINSLVDERRDPYKSTVAAVQYLKDMYRIYNDWNLVIAAYNCGPGNVNKAIRRSGGKRDYWEIYEYLPKETRGYVPAFIAATYIMNYYPDHNICPSETDFPSLVDTLGVNKMLHLEQVAAIIKEPIENLRALNPQFKEDIIPGEFKEYALKLPMRSLTAFVDKEEEIYAYRAEELLTHQKVRMVATRESGGGGGAATYRVKRGDTLGAIAGRHGVSVAQIKNWNNMSSDKLSVGKYLQVAVYVPPKEPKRKIVPAQKVGETAVSELVADNGVLKRNTTITKTSVSHYQVKKGDTWAGVSKATGVTAADIKKWNGIRNNRLVANRRLKIYKTETAEELAEVGLEKRTLGVNTTKITDFLESYLEDLELTLPSTELNLDDTASNHHRATNDDLDDVETIYHKIKFGETISQIAAKYKVSVNDILNWNNLANDLDAKVNRLLIFVPRTDASQIANNEADEVGETAHL